MKQPYSDKEIIAGVQTEDDRIIKYWYKRDFSYVKNYVLKNSGTESDAKEIYQDAFLVVYQKIAAGTFQPTATIKTFLSVVARNLWLKHLRDNRQPMIVEDIEELQIADIGDTYDWQADEQEKKIMEKISQLGQGCQKILKLYYFNKNSLREIAGKLGYKAEKNARNAKYKCMQQLRKTFKK